MTNVVAMANYILHDVIIMPNYKIVLQVKSHDVNVHEDRLVNLGNIHGVHVVNAAH